MFGISVHEDNDKPYRAKQPPHFDNILVTRLSTASSPKSGMAMLADSAIDLALHDERAVLLDVDYVHLDVRTLHVHDGKGLLPIARTC